MITLSNRRRRTWGEKRLQEWDLNDARARLKLAEDTITRILGKRRRAEIDGARLVAAVQERAWNRGRLGLR